MARRWWVVALGLGLFYLLAGLGFGALAQGATSGSRVVFWRLAAWLVSGIAFVTHIGYERSRGHSPGVAAWHASLAAACGASSLAVAALLHALTSHTGRPRLLAIAIVVWPVMTAIAAFLVAWLTAAVVFRRPRTQA